MRNNKFISYRFFKIKKFHENVRKSIYKKVEKIIKKYKKKKTPTNVKSILIAYIKRKLIKKLKSL